MGNMKNKDEKSILRSARFKIIFIGLILGGVFVCASIFLSYRYMEEKKSQRFTHLKQMVQIARNTVEPILAEYRSQKISKADAIEQVRNLVRRMVYSDHVGQNYIFMANYDGTLLVHPIDPEIEMTNQLNYADADGVYFGKYLIGVAKSEEGQGYVTYRYYTPGKTFLQKKTTFVIGVPEIQCYIATGQYIDDINKSQKLFVVKVAGLTSGLLFILSLLVWTSMEGFREQNKMLNDVNKKLYSAERELTTMFDNSFHFIGSLSPDGVLRKVNRTALEAIHAQETDVVGKPFWETTWWKKEDAIEKLKKAISEGSEGKFCRFEATNETWDLGSLYVDFNLSPVFDEKGRVVSLLAEAKDITEQVKIRNDLIREQTFFEYIVKSFPGLFFLFKLEDGQYRLKKWNEEQHKKLLGFSPDDMQNFEMSKMISEEDHPLLKNAVKQSLEKERVYVKLNAKTKNGGTIPVLYLGTHFTHAGDDYIVGTGIELTEKIRAEEEKKRLEGMLVQAQKMEAMGNLAGGIAHDFNNILSAIIGYAEMVENGLSDEDPSKEMQRQVLKAAIRARDLVQQILLFSRRSSVKRKPLQLKLIVKEAVKLLRSSIPSTIDIKQNVPGKTGMILADPTQMHQIVMNLCTNAYHAMRETGGTLSVSLTERTVVEEDSMCSGLMLKPGAYVMLDVSDTGHGMDRDTIARIFDPYFTTKGVGEGTGLGLAVVHGIVKSCGGEIRVYSEPEAGTRFHLYFPRIEQDNNGDKETEKVVLRKGDEKVLLIDDDKMNNNMMLKSLTKLGYHVSAFLDSQKALDAFSQAPDSFDLVVTDMTMPKMTGLDLAKRILSARPQTPIILCTGYSELVTREKARAIGINAFLLKPVLREELARIIREVLDTDASPQTNRGGCGG